MKKLLPSFCLILVSHIAQAGLPAPIASALKKAGVPESSTSIYVQAVDGKHVQLSLNANKPMNPASVMKLVTTYAALDLLKPTFRWKTEVYRDGVVEDGILHGNLIIKGYGDPSFKADEFRRLLVSVRQQGLKKITGNLIIDKSYFARSVANHRVFDNKKWRSYNALPSAFLVNGRHTSFKFTAHEGKVNISQEVELPEVKIVNNMTLVKNGCGSWRNRLTYDVNTSRTKAAVTFGGKFSSHCGEKYLELSLFDDEHYAYFMFKNIWRQLGGVFNGKLRSQTEMPLQVVKLVVQDSQPLANIVRDVNKWSNNVMARQVLLTVAANYHDQPASEVRGMLAVKSWMADNGWNADSWVIENGSGLSRIERVTAKVLGGMLLDAYEGPLMSELMSSLPILSLDGTLISRLRKKSVSGRAHMKTGSIKGVKAIAGYVLDAKNRRSVVVMIVNHAKASSSQKAQDALIEWVYNRP
ncbi:MAG: D-alanyl-D-alanine carboxypeptidase/D-alanyl-D-alanine-endopeptidase (penicillin-binding protein 4) [Methylophilaceae bacterium]|jgi:D-alanyl-D-alanine carboxypeptidase/D-alanyl-D-alanine-endopeptidase (penicillin-binding protein 4)